DTTEPRQAGVFRKYGLRRVRGFLALAKHDSSVRHGCEPVEAIEWQRSRGCLWVPATGPVQYAICDGHEDLFPASASLGAADVMGDPVAKVRIFEDDIEACQHLSSRSWRAIRRRDNRLPFGSTRRRALRVLTAIHVSCICTSRYAKSIGDF